MDDTIHSNTGGDLRAQLELALRFLSAQAGEIPMELKPGELALDLPVPEGGRALGTLLGGGAPIRMLIESPRDGMEALEEFDSQLRANGWTEQYMGLLSGFLPSISTPIPSHYVSPAQDMTLMVMVVGQPGGASTITVTVFGPPDPASLDARRDFSMRRRHEALQAAMPPLRGPRGATVTVEGGGGSDRSWRTYARMTTTLDLAAIAAHYDEQLARADLVKAGGGADGSTCWSLWSVTVDNEPMSVVFFAVRLPESDGEYLLEARIEGRESRQSQGGWTTYGAIRSAVNLRPRQNP